MDDEQLAQLLYYFDGSWKGYRKVRKGVKKRVSRHMQALGSRTMAEYLQRLSADADAREECRRLMTVPISRFFRDRYLWEILTKRVLPELIERGDDPVSVWCAGCAGGEEPYSFRIMWEEFAERYARMPRLELVATDLNAENLDRAQVGLYPEGSLREVDDDRRSRFFMREKKRFIVRPEIKEGIVWKKHDLLSDDPPVRTADLLFLRNSILTYEHDNRKAEAFFRAAKALRPDGFLIIGAREKLPPGAEKLLARFDRYIYRRCRI